MTDMSNTTWRDEIGNSARDVLESVRDNRRGKRDYEQAMEPNELMKTIVGVCWSGELRARSIKFRTPTIKGLNELKAILKLTFHADIGYYRGNEKQQKANTYHYE